jgi:uncharacterized protein (TIGR03435 family)
VELAAAGGGNHSVGHHRIEGTVNFQVISVGALLLASTGLINLRAQTPAPQFEVASIKPNHSASGGMLIGMQPGGRFSATNATVKQLIMIAYGIKPQQLSGGPGWADSDRYDVVAKPEGPANQDQIKVMIQGLLADRFKLSLHQDSKEMQIFALVVAKGGPKIEEVKEPGPGRRGIRMGLGLMEAQQTTMPDFAGALSNLAGRTVVDKTGLTGIYNVKLEFTPDESQGRMGRGPGDGKEGGPPPPDPAGPSLFIAIQEQLGLKLEAQKGEVVTFMIDHVEKPTEN